MNQRQHVPLHQLRARLSDNLDKTVRNVIQAKSALHGKRPHHPNVRQEPSIRGLRDLIAI